MSDAKTAMLHGTSHEAQAPDRAKRFRRLNRLFWLCWTGLPISIGIAYWRIASQIPAALGGYSPEARRCLSLLPNPDELSLTGLILYWLFFVFHFSIYFFVLWILHRMLKQFASGKIFISATLAGMRSLGVMLVLWPFLGTAVSYAVGIALKANQQLPFFWQAPFNVNFELIPVGVFLLALKVVIEHAIDIKSYNELTI